MRSKELWQITGHYFCVGIEFTDGLVSDVAPILESVCPLDSVQERCLSYFKSRGFACKRLQSTSHALDRARRAY